MITTSLGVSLGDGGADAHLHIGRTTAAPARRWVGAVAAALVAPMILIMTAQAAGSISGRYSLDTLLGAPRAPWTALLAAATLAAVAGVLVLLAARLRVTVRRDDGRVSATVTMRVSTLELVALGLGALLLAAFAAHLVADSVACANGVRRAC